MERRKQIICQPFEKLSSYCLSWTLEVQAQRTHKPNALRRITDWGKSRQRKRDVACLALNQPLTLVQLSGLSAL